MMLGGPGPKEVTPEEAGARLNADELRAQILRLPEGDDRIPAILDRIAQDYRAAPGADTVLAVVGGPPEGTEDDPYWAEAAALDARLDADAHDAILALGAAHPLAPQETQEVARHLAESYASRLTPAARLERAEAELRQAWGSGYERNLANVQRMLADLSPMQRTALEASGAIYDAWPALGLANLHAREFGTGRPSVL